MKLAGVLTLVGAGAIAIWLWFLAPIDPAEVCGHNPAVLVSVFGYPHTSYDGTSNGDVDGICEHNARAQVFRGGIVAIPLFALGAGLTFHGIDAEAAAANRAATPRWTPVPSPDGKWLWDGDSWRPAPIPPPPSVAPPPEASSKAWTWDGERWS